MNGSGLIVGYFTRLAKPLRARATHERPAKPKTRRSWLADSKIAFGPWRTTCCVPRGTLSTSNGLIYIDNHVGCWLLYNFFGKVHIKDPSPFDFPISDRRKNRASAGLESGVHQPVTSHPHSLTHPLTHPIPSLTLLSSAKHTGFDEDIYTALALHSR